MIRIRTSTGQVTEVLQEGFVEILASSGEVAMALFLDPKVPSVEVIQAGTPAARRYGGLFQVPFVPVVTINNLPQPAKLPS